jgi:hypothetical protein
MDYLFKAPDRRFKMLRVTYDVLADLLFNTRMKPDQTPWGPADNGPFGTIRALEIDGIPPDARVEAIALDAINATASLRIWSASFPEVHPSEYAPELQFTLMARDYHIVVPQQDYERGLAATDRCPTCKTSLATGETDCQPDVTIPGPGARP